ncbi:unnamed protein product [Durusdinium trenchii]|uniref:DNA (cytosine-5-)-methyltransferase n=1 Tax=Durusdinium trenchii TaxID=1381693 RepID=A0ABP0IV44_9DINO
MFSEGKKWAPGLRGCEREGGQSLAGSLLAVATHAQCIEAMPVARAVDTLSASEDDLEVAEHHKRPAAKKLAMKANVRVSQRTPKAKAGLKKRSCLSMKTKTKLQKLRLLGHHGFLPSKISLQVAKGLPHCGLVSKGAQTVVPYKVVFAQANPLSWKCVQRNRKGVIKKDLKAKLFTGTKVFKTWASIRRFSATTSAAKSSVSERGITDQANRIKYGTQYQQACHMAGVCLGRHLTPATAEWFSGLPSGWTSSAVGAVNVLDFRRQFPYAATTEGKLPIVSLFSGICGLELGVSRWMYATDLVECDQDCTTVLRQRMAEGLLHKAVIHPDVCKFSAKETGACGVTAGFPCQGVSSAGLQNGLGDERTKLIEEVWRVFDTLPRQLFLLLENVGALLSKEKQCRALLHYILKAAKRSLDVHWATTRLTNVGLPASRARVFLLLAARGESLWEDYICPEVETHCRAWNPIAQQPMYKWLSQEQSKKDKVRLNMCGNMVVPCQATLAFESLLTMRRAAQHL